MKALQALMKPVERKWIINPGVTLSIMAPYDPTTRPYTSLQFDGPGAGISEKDRDKINELLRDIDDWCDFNLDELPPSGPR